MSSATTRGVVRTATERDDAALCALMRRTPMQGRIEMVLERDPEFLALTRALGEHAEVLVVEGKDGDVVALGTHVPETRAVRGAPTAVSYLADLRVDRAHRRSGHASALLEAARERMKAHGSAFGFALVMGGNALMKPVLEADGPLDFRSAATIRNHTLFVALLRHPDRARVRRARPADVPAMVALANRTALELGPMYTEASFLARVAAIPGLTLERFFVLERGGEIASFAALWDASAVKRVRLVRLDASLRLARRLLGLFTRVPRDGETIRFAYATMCAARDADALRPVLEVMLEDARANGSLYLDVAFDVNDPLTTAVRTFVGTSVDFELCLVTPSGSPPVELGARPLHFDMAMV